LSVSVDETAAAAAAAAAVLLDILVAAAVLAAVASIVTVPHTHADYGECAAAMKLDVEQHNTTQKRRQTKYYNWENIK
jgi:hypothetical protein